MPQATADPVADLLRYAPIKPADRAAAWDAFEHAANEDALADALTPLAVPKAVKAQLWEMKHAQSATQVPAPMTFARVNGQDVPVEASTWERVNTPLIPQIKQAAHAIADAMARPRLGDAQLNEHLKGLGTLSAMLRGGGAGMVEGAGDVLSGFTSPVGIALLLSGMSGESALVREIPVLRTLLKLPAVKGLQRAVQVSSGAAFAAHGAGTVATDPTLAGKAQGVVEMATGGLGMASAAGARRPNVISRVPEEEAAVRAGQAAGVPVDLATVTGNRAVRGAQFLADRTLGGSVIAKTAEQRAAQGFKDWGGRLAAQANRETATVGAQTPETSGLFANEQIAGKIQEHGETAAYAYARAEKIARARAERVQTGTKTTTSPLVDASGRPIIENSPTYQKINAPMDVSAMKTELQPMYTDLLRQSELVPLQGGKARALVALDRLMHGPDLVPLLTAERATSDLGALAGHPDLPELRTPGQGVAASAFGALRNRVDRAAAMIGPEMMKALREGRAATKAKYEAADLFDALKQEPVKAFRQATEPKDAGIEFLRTIKRLIPESLPQIARAKLEDVMTLSPDKAFTEWQKVGQATRRELFPSPGHVQALDHFFLLQKQMATNANPSGTAYVGSLLAQAVQLGSNPAIGIPVQVGAAGLSAALHSPAVTRALTRALVIHRSPAASSSARAAALASLSGAVRQAQIPALVPSSAQADEPPEQ